jgi:hypothetical protein
MELTPQEIPSNGNKNNSIFYKQIKLFLEPRSFIFDIYWADPRSIFKEEIIDRLPLASTVFPNGNNIPNPRIYLHTNLTIEYKSVFEAVIAHEIGHLWLYDIIHVHNQLTPDEREVWADYFAFYFFAKYRNITDLEQFSQILNEVLLFQGKIYNIPPSSFDSVFGRKAEDINALVENIQLEYSKGDLYNYQIAITIEPILNSLGDIFN